LAKFEFDSSASEKYFDVITEVGFEQPLNDRDTVKVLQIISDILTSRIADRLFEGLVSLEINQTTLCARFRYSTAAYPSPARESSGLAEEDYNRLIMDFLFFFFASVDRQYRLADIPFPPSFRYFLDLSDHMRKYFDWDLDGNVL
jgi:hypothetical protein